MLSKQIRFVNFKRNENQTQRMHTCWSETVSAGSGSAAHCYSCYKKKEKRKRSCLAASLTDSADTKEEDSLFSHRYLCPSPSTRTPLNKKKKALQSLALVSGATWTPDITFNRGAQLHLQHCQSQKASELQARRCRANQ